MQINHQNLVASRNRLGLTQSALSNESGIPQRTIARLEAGPVKGKNRKNVIDALAKALKIAPEQLCGSAPIEHERDPEKKEWGVGVLKEHVKIATMYGLDMIEKTYGVSARKVIELAPLMFVLLAERSLAERTANADAIQETLAQLSAFSGESDHLNFVKNTGEVSDALEAERWSIAAKDIFADQMYKWDFNWTFTTDGQNPFDVTLKRLLPSDKGMAREVTRSSHADEWTLFDDALWDTCRGDDAAVEAIMGGHVRVTSIPKHLHGDDQLASRVSWLKEQLPPDVRFEFEEMEKRRRNPDGSFKIIKLTLPESKDHSQ